MKVLRLVLGLVLIGGALIDNSVSWPLIPFKPPVIEIAKPSDYLIELTKNVANTIKSDDDREAMAFFVYEASLRLDTELYANDVTYQQFNDIFNAAGKEYFAGASYPEFAVELQKVTSPIVGEYDVYMGNKASDLSDVFESLAWNLVN